MTPRIVLCAAWVVLLAAVSCCALSLSPRHEHNVTLFDDSVLAQRLYPIDARSSKSSKKVVPVHSMAKKKSKKQAGKGKKKKALRPPHAPQGKPAPKTISPSDQFCKEFIKQCYHIAVDGQKGEQQVVYACQRNGNKYSSSYDFGCKVNGRDVTPAVLDSLSGYAATSTHGTTLIVTATTTLQSTNTQTATATATSTRISTLTPTTTATVNSLTTTTAIDSQSTIKTATDTSSTTTTVLTGTPTTTTVTSLSTETETSTSTVTTASVNTVTTTGTVTEVSTIPYTTTTTTTSTATTTGVIVPVTIVRISGTPERRRQVRVVAEFLLRRASTTTNDDTQFCRAFAQECSLQCQRVRSTIRYETCHRTATTSQYEQYRLACTCLNRKVETQHALAAVVSDQRIASVSTVSTMTTTVTDTMMYTATSTLTTTALSLSTTTRPVTTTYTSQSTSVYPTTTVTTILTTVTSTGTEIDRSTTAIVTTATSSSTSTTRTTTTTTTSTPTTTTVPATSTTTTSTSTPAATATVVSLTVTVVAPTGSIRIQDGNGASSFVTLSPQNTLSYASGPESQASQFMPIRDQNSGLYQMYDVGQQEALLFSPEVGDFTNPSAYAYLTSGDLGGCGGNDATQAAPFVPSNGGSNGIGCEGYSFELAYATTDFAVHPTWWDSGADQPMYVTPYLYPDYNVFAVFPETTNPNKYYGGTFTPITFTFVQAI